MRSDDSNKIKIWICLDLETERHVTPLFSGRAIDAASSTKVNDWTACWCDNGPRPTDDNNNKRRAKSPLKSNATINALRVKNFLDPTIGPDAIRWTEKAFYRK